MLRGEEQVHTSESIIVTCTNDTTTSRIPVCGRNTLFVLKFTFDSTLPSLGAQESFNCVRIKFKGLISRVGILSGAVSLSHGNVGPTLTATTASFLASQTLEAHQ
jgi:hypothetical protein